MPPTHILPEVWTLVGTHLPPHHLYKLLCTSKQIKETVDNHAYWTQVAGQLIWRDCESMEIHPCGRCEFDVMPRIETDLYDIQRNGTDYHRLMERFFDRMEEMKVTYTKGAQQMLDENLNICFFGNNNYTPDWWKTTFQQPQHTRNITLYLLSAWQHNIKIMDDEAFISQKELAQRVTVAILSTERAIVSAGEFETMRGCVQT